MKNDEFVDSILVKKKKHKLVTCDDDLQMEEERLIQRAQEERQKIFERYARGRSSDNDIDPWEDPAFEIYHQTDK